MSDLKTMIGHKSFLKEVLDKISNKRKASELEYLSERYQSKESDRWISFNREDYILEKLLTIEEEIKELYLQVAGWVEFMETLANSESFSSPCKKR